MSADQSSLQGLAARAHDARAWPFEQAKALLARLARTRPSGETRPVIFETGYGPSGLPHIGTFQEVARTTMVRNAFRALTDDAIPTRLIAFSDDMDGLRKVPPGLPHQDWLEEDLHKPLTQVRDPFGEEASFGAYNNARLRRFLDGFGFDYEFKSSTTAYRLRRVRRDAAQGAGAVRRDPGGDAADAGAGASRHLLAFPAHQPQDRPRAAGPHPFGRDVEAGHDRLRGRGRGAHHRPRHRRAM